MVVADRKTPNEGWHDFHERVHYLSLEEQEKQFPRLSQLIGFDTYARKNLGYVYAAANAADIIFETDDDTFLRPSIGDPVERMAMCREATLAAKKMSTPVWNPYALFANDSSIWPRGYPLGEIHSAHEWSMLPTHHDNTDSFVLQMLVANEPDVDAIFRLTRSSENIQVDLNTDLVVGLPEALVPGNTQATVWMGSETFEWMYVPHTVSFRFSDILRSYVIQAGVELRHAGFWVEQRRNPHDLMADFIDEVSMHTHLAAVIQTVLRRRGATIESVYADLVDKEIVQQRELACLREFKSALTAALETR